MKQNIGSKKDNLIHSRENHSVPFTHAEWSLKHIPKAELCEAGLVLLAAWAFVHRKQPRTGGSG